MRVLEDVGREMILSSDLMPGSVSERPTEGQVLPVPLCTTVRMGSEQDLGRG
jgi:hypothetical protein